MVFKHSIPFLNHPLAGKQFIQKGALAGFVSYVITLHRTPADYSSLNKQLDGQLKATVNCEIKFAYLDVLNNKNVKKLLCMLKETERNPWENPTCGEILVIQATYFQKRGSSILKCGDSQKRNFYLKSRSH